jgi:hypothetical protein
MVVDTILSIASKVKKVWCAVMTTRLLPSKKNRKRKVEECSAQNITNARLPRQPKHHQLTMGGMTNKTVAANSNTYQDGLVTPILEEVVAFVLIDVKSTH